MLSVALFEPQIPPNTGTIARLCAAMDIPLHIVGRPAFRLDDKAVKRAGLDYWPHVQLHQHRSLTDVPTKRILCFTTKSNRPYTEFIYEPGDCLLFGPETAGLPASILAAHPDTCLTIPMANPNIRSLNLAVSVAMVLGEALRQTQWAQLPK